MRIAVVGASAVAGLVFAATVAALVPNVGFAQRPAQSASSGGPLITLTSQVNEHKQQVTVIDQDTHTMAVYHIDGTNGEIVLKSVRNIHFDLKMLEFNGTTPLPREVRALIEQR